MLTARTDAAYTAGDISPVCIELKPMARPLPAPLRLIVFDWDGTLMDSIACMVACAQQTLRALNRTPLDAETIRGTIGLGLEEIMERLFPKGSPQMAERFVTHYRQQWFATFCHQALLFAGVESMLEDLVRMDYLLAVATSKSRQGLERDLQQTGLRRRFQATRTIDEAPSKPSPVMLLAICEELGVRPEETLMVGDTPFDLLMTDNADVAALGVLTGSHDRQALLACKPVSCLDRAAELGDWIRARIQPPVAAVTAP